MSWQLVAGVRELNPMVLHVTLRPHGMQLAAAPRHRDRRPRRTEHLPWKLSVGECSHQYQGNNRQMSHMYIHINS